MSSQTRPTSLLAVSRSAGQRQGRGKGNPLLPQLNKLYEGDLTMPKSDIEKVLTVVQGIGDRDADLATKYMREVTNTSAEAA